MNKPEFELEEAVVNTTGATCSTPDEVPSDYIYVRNLHAQVNWLCNNGRYGGLPQSCVVPIERRKELLRDLFTLYKLRAGVDVNEGDWT